MTADQNPHVAKVSTQQAPRRSTVRRVLFWIAVAWFFIFHFLLVLFIDISVIPNSHESASGWLLLFYAVGGAVWLASAYWIYDELFRMAQARWPEAKGIREILSPLLRSFLFHRD